jgi:glycosyltransferase involved in cell wall biosynthesis
VIASDLPATRDVLAGVPGVRTTQPENVASLAGALISVLRDEEDAISEAAAARVMLLDRFDWDAVAAGYGDLLETVRTGRPNP